MLDPNLIPTPLLHPTERPAWTFARLRRGFGRNEIGRAERPLNM